MLGVVLLDNIDSDWSFVALGPDEKGHYGVFDLGVSLPTAQAAREALAAVLVENETLAVFPQGDDDVDANRSHRDLSVITHRSHSANVKPSATSRLKALLKNGFPNAVRKAKRSLADHVRR